MKSKRKIDIYKEQLESLRQEVLLLKTMCKFAVPRERYASNNGFFKAALTELGKVIIGKICIISSDRKSKQYNTISFDILIEALLDDKDIKDKEILREFKERIKEINGKYKSFRDKGYAHIELDLANNRYSIDSLMVSGKDIEASIIFLEEIYNEIFRLLDRVYTNFAEDDLNDMNKKIWEGYLNKGLVKKI